MQGVGDPLGALIAMQLERKEGPVSVVDDAELWTFMFAHREQLFGRFANHWWASWADSSWRWGILRRAQLRCCRRSTRQAEGAADQPEAASAPAHRARVGFGVASRS